MWHLFPPTDELLTQLAEQQAEAELSYSTEGVTRHWEVGLRQQVKGYDVDQNVCVLGEGEACYLAAVAGLRQWKMFPRWAQVRGSQGQQKGSIIQLCFHLLGLHWHSFGRVVYDFEEEHVAGAQHRVGFAYGTLVQHVESGEERFSVAWLKDGRVVYELQAFSQPRYWMARCAKPLARHWQKKFVRESQQSFQSYVQDCLTTH
jgi:uncharacterized protein (UPF0548 family)